MAQGNERILVVDDDEVTCEMFAKGLAQIGYRCVIAGTVEDAEQALQKEEFELMLLDIGMPGRSGLNLLPELTRRYPDMAIVMVTGHDQLDTAVLAMREGAYDYLTKPVSLGLLILSVGKALERRESLLENQAYHVGDKAFDVEGLETVIDDLNLRLEEAKREAEAQNSAQQNNDDGAEGGDSDPDVERDTVDRAK